MSPAGVLLESYRGLVRYPLRTALSLLALVIGVASVVGTIGLISAARELTIRGITRLGGLDVVRVRSPSVRFRDGRMHRITKRVALGEVDARRLRSAVPGARAAMPHIELGLPVKSRAATVAATVEGGGSTTLEFLPLTVVSGRFFSAAEAESAARVAALSRSIADDLFGAEEPVGNEVTIAGQRFLIVGIVQVPVEDSGQEPKIAYLPFRTVLERLGPDPTDAELLLATGNSEQLAETELAVRAALPFLRPGIGVDSYDIETPLEQLAEVAATTRMQAVILGGVALLALVAAGSGILNTFLVGVRERTREIGTRRALGARRLTILSQFLGEAVALGIPGALLGIAAGIGVAHGLGAVFAGGLDEPSLMAVRIGRMEAGIGAAAAFGVAVVAGLWPAWQAASISPAEALRHE